MKVIFFKYRKQAVVYHAGQMQRGSKIGSCLGAVFGSGKIQILDVINYNI